MADEEADKVEESEEETETEVEEEAQPDKKEGEREDESNEESEDVPVRSTASYIIKRKDKKIKKLQSELEAKEEIPLEDRLKRLEQAQSVEGELASLFNQHPEAKKYEPEIRKYMTHEAYQSVPVEFIYKGLSADDVKSQTDSKRKAADLEAEQTSSAGSVTRSTKSGDEKTAEEIKNMSDKEFREYEQEQRRRARS